MSENQKDNENQGKAPAQKRKGAKGPNNPFWGTGKSQGNDEPKRSNRHRDGDPSSGLKEALAFLHPSA
jgi:hypothetical protein